MSIYFWVMKEKCLFSIFRFINYIKALENGKEGINVQKKIRTLVLNTS